MVSSEMQCWPELVVRVCCWLFGLDSDAVVGGDADVIVWVVLGRL